MNNQKGYIKIVLVVFALLIGVMIFPLKFPSRGQPAECRVGDEVDPKTAPSVFLPPIINVGGGVDLPGGWDETSADVEYVLLRKNIPVFTNSSNPNYILGYPDIVGNNIPPPPTVVIWPLIADVDYLGVHADTRHTLRYDEANQPGFHVYYPNESGELGLPKEIVNRNGVTARYLTARTEGFLFFVHLGEDGNAVKLNYGDHIYYLMDLYQDKRMYEAENKGYELDDLFHCLDPESRQPQSFIVEPEQEKSQLRDQLQLQWFVMTGKPGMSAHCKPAVYLYPKQKQLVNVRVFPKGELGYTDPVYDAVNGWFVEAYPDGNLFNFMNHESGSMNYGKSQYDYLYYETKLRDEEIKKPERGWVVSGLRDMNQESRELERLFDEVLPKLGLSKKEKRDFEEYWLKTLPESPYYFVGLVEKSDRDRLEQLQVTPKPDTSIRFSLYFEPLDNPVSVLEPVIHTPKREGFTLVDWGGMIKLHKDTSFTCSQ